MTILTEVRQNAFQVLTRQDGKPSVLTLGFVTEFCMYPVSIYFGIPLYIRQGNVFLDRDLTLRSSF